MANGVSTADILRPVSVDVLYNPPAVEQNSSWGTGFWNTTTKFLTGIADALPQVLPDVVRYFVPPTSSAARTVPYPTTTAPVRDVGTVMVPPRGSAAGFPPTVSDLPLEGGDAFAGVNRNTLLLLGAGAVAVVFLLRR